MVAFKGIPIIHLANIAILRAQRYVENICSILKDTIEYYVLAASCCMIEFGLALSTLLSSELILWIPLTKTAHILASTLQKSKKVLLSRHISDNWKEKILPVYALRIFRSSVVLPLWLLLLGAPILIGTLLLSSSYSDALEHLTSLGSLAIITLTSVLYLTVRFRFFNARLFKI